MSRLLLKYLFLMLCLASSSCIDEDLTCATDYLFKIKAVDNSGNDISPSGVAGAANVYLFDKNKGYLDMIQVTADQITNSIPIKITHNGGGDLWAVVWSNLNGNQHVDQPQKGVLMSEVLIKMLRDNADNALSPDDIFYGAKNINPKTNNTRMPESEIAISRMTARMNIVVRGLDPKYESDYRFVIDDALYDSYNFEGKLTGELVRYSKSGNFNSEGSFSTPEPFLIFPTFRGNILKVSIYYGNDLLASIHTDSEGALISPFPGTTENIFIDIKQLPATTAVKIVVTDWNKVYQWLEW